MKKINIFGNYFILTTLLFVALFGVAILAPQIAKASTSFSGVVSAFNGPLSAQGQACVQSPYLISNNLNAGDTISISDLSGQYCDRQDHQWCGSSISYGCVSGYVKNCTGPGPQIGFYNNTTLISSVNLNSALNGSVTVPAGATSAYIYISDRANEYHDNNGAYKCTFYGSVTPSCTPNVSKQCVGNSVYNFDSCGNQGTLVQNCGGSQTCSYGACVSNCTPNYYLRCAGNNSYWFDSCGTQGNVYQTCTNGCNANSGYCNFVSASVSPNPANVNQLVTFTATVNGANSNTSYSWSGACAGFASSCQTSFPSAGTFTAYLTVTSNSQSQTVSVPVTVIAAVPSLALSTYASPNPAVTGQQIQFTSAATGGNGSYSYLWTGACTGTQSTCQNSFFLAGNYTAYLTVISGSQTATSSVNVNVAQATPTCTPNATQQCVGNSVYYFDSCGNQGNFVQACSGNQTCSAGQCITSCTQNTSRQCVGNSVYYFDSCGNQGSLIQTCVYNQTCSAGQCVTSCTQNATKACYNGSVYNFDSCGNVGSLYQTCSNGCANGACTVPTCTQNSYRGCVGRNAYWFDSCGTQGGLAQDCGFGTCSAGQCILNSFSLSCIVNPSQVSTNQLVTYNSFINLPTNNVSGSVNSLMQPAYTYSWSGACTGNSNTCVKSFPSSGSYTANLTVTVGTVTQSASCTANVIGSSSSAVLSVPMASSTPMVSATPPTYNYNSAYSFIVR